MYMKFIFTKLMYRATMKCAKSIMYINQYTLINVHYILRPSTRQWRVRPSICQRGRAFARLFANVPACASVYLPTCPRACSTARPTAGRATFNYVYQFLLETFEFVR